MKRPQKDDRRNNNNNNSNSKQRRIKHERGRSQDEKVTALLKICLQKVCELQADLLRNNERENDPEAAGYAACAIETIRFLSAEGVPSDHPIVKGLTERLMRDRDSDD